MCTITHAEMYVVTMLAEAEARSEGDETVRPEHLEAALAELLADFS